MAGVHIWLLHTRSQQHIHCNSASVQDRCVHCSALDPHKFAPIVPALKSKPYGKSRLSWCISLACFVGLEHISNNLALSSCKRQGPCQVPVFLLSTRQQLNSFSGLSATFQRERTSLVIAGIAETYSQPHNKPLLWSSLHYYEVVWMVLMPILKN